MQVIPVMAHNILVDIWLNSTAPISAKTLRFVFDQLYFFGIGKSNKETTRSNLDKSIFKVLQARRVTNKLMRGCGLTWKRKHARESICLKQRKGKFCYLQSLLSRLFTAQFSRFGKHIRQAPTLDYTTVSFIQ